MARFSRTRSRGWQISLLLSLAVVFSFGIAAQAQDALPQDSKAKPKKTKATKWDELKAHYDYEKTPQGKPLTVTEKPQDDTTFEGKTLSLTHLEFTNAKGKTAPGLYLRPKAEGVYPVVVLLHGLGSNKETMIRYFGRYLAAHGIACVALDAAQHGERREPDQEASDDGAAFVNIIRETVGDYRLLLDWLATRKEVNSKQIGAFGYGLGSIMLSILGPVDDRIQAGMFCVGGDPIISSLDALPPEVRSTASASCPSLYIPYFTPRPALFINATNDSVMTRASSDRLLNAAKEPKTIWWVESGPILPAPDVQRGMDWLSEKLGVKPTPAASSNSQ